MVQGGREVDGTQEAAALLGLQVEAEPAQAASAPGPTRRPKPERPPSRPRPLMIRAAPNSQPPAVVLLVAGAGEQKERQQEIKLPVRQDDITTLNSYQRAKLRCADKFKCDLCGKGFPLSCLLQVCCSDCFYI